MHYRKINKIFDFYSIKLHIIENYLECNFEYIFKLFQSKHYNTLIIKSGR